MVSPLNKTYDPANPFVVERHDQDDGAIHYEIWDVRPDTYRRVCTIEEGYNDDSDDGALERGQSKMDADMIVTALNMVFGQRKFKSAKLRVLKARGVK